jgi:hypothetical protein
MSAKPPVGLQISTIVPLAPIIQESFDLNRLDIFVNSLGIDIMHYRAIPSPIGQNDRGSWRRNDGVDTITSNGMIYRYAGTFTATLTTNEREEKRGVSGQIDPSEARLVMQRFYNANGGQDNGDRIYLAPGDRIYIADPNADVLVANSQKMDYEEGIDNVPLFPIVKLQDAIVDSRNIEYNPNVDYVITDDGNIRWLPGGNNPGIDPLTGKGRVYSIVYLYRGFYYVVALPHEIRITCVTAGGVRAPARMAQHAVIMREYIFHNQNKGGKLNQNAPPVPQRVDSAPVESINPNKFVIPVDMSSIDTSPQPNHDRNKDEDQS